jgi:DUF1009 family protein
MIAIIAGTGSLPIAACLALKNKNKPFCVINLFPQENGAALLKAAGKALVIDIAFYKASYILNHLIKQGVTHVLMIGKVNKQDFFKNIKLDWLAVKLLASVMYKNDRDLLQRIVDEFATHGITVLRQHDILPGLLTQPGIITGIVDEAVQHDINLGMLVASNISKLDLGQTVVVKNNMVLAVEAIEGTDACIDRGINLGRGDVIICKSAQAAHNQQFDLPTLGSATLQKIEPGQIRAIAWLASHTLIADYNQFVKSAVKLNITLVAV